MAVLLDLGDFVILELREHEILADQAAVGVRVGADAQVALGHERNDVFLDGAVFVEELFRLVGLEPVLENLEVLLGVACGSERHLVSAPRALGLLAVDELRAGPALRGAEDEVERTINVVRLRGGLDVADLVPDVLEQVGETTVDGHVVLIVEASDELVRFVAHAMEELVELFVGDTGEDGRVGDLVAVEVQNRQHDAVGARVHELVGLPAGGQRAGLGFAVADDGRHEQARVVEDCAVSVGQSVAELATLMDGARGLRRVMGRNAARVRELTEELRQALLIVGDVRTNLEVGAVQVGLCGAGRAAVARAHDDHSVLLVIGDETVDVADEEVQARGGAPVTDKTMLDVIAGERLPHERVLEKVDLTDGQVVGSAPILVNAFERLLGDCSVELLPRCANNRTRHMYSCNFLHRSAFAINLWGQGVPAFFPTAVQHTMCIRLLTPCATRQKPRRLWKFHHATGPAAATAPCYPLSCTMQGPGGDFSGSVTSPALCIGAKPSGLALITACLNGSYGNKSRE